MDGLYIASPTGEILEHFNESNCLECTTILCVEENLNGACWFGLDEGLAHFNPNGAESAFISQEQNIGDVYDYALWNNTLYLGTNKGLYRIDEDKKAHLVTGTSGIAWNIVNCKDFLAVEKYHYDIFHRNGAKLHYKDISSNFSAHIMTMQAENILKNTYAKR